MAFKKAGEKKSKFVYRERDPDNIRQRAERTGAHFDGIFKDNIDQYASRNGDNQFRILPPTWDDPEHYGYTVWVHQFVGAEGGSYLCLAKMLNKKCPICIAAKEAERNGDKEEAKQLFARERIVCWVIDRDGDDDTRPMAFNMSWTVDRDIAAQCPSKKTGKVLVIDHPDNGYDVFMKKSGTGLKTKYYGISIDRDASPVNDNDKVQQEILDFVEDNPIPSILKFQTPEYLEAVMSGETADDKDEDVEDTVEEKRGRKYADKSNDDTRDEKEERHSRRERDEAKEDDEVKEQRPKPGRETLTRRAVQQELPLERGRKAQQQEEEEEEPEDDIPFEKEEKQDRPPQRRSRYEEEEETERKPIRRR